MIKKLNNNRGNEVIPPSKEKKLLQRRFMNATWTKVQTKLLLAIVPKDWPTTAIRCQKL